MYAFLNKKLGALLLFPLILLGSLFVSTVFADTASAVDGTWTDATTISVNGKSYKDAGNGPLQGLGSSGTYRIFGPANLTDKSRVFFNTNDNLRTVRTAKFTTSGVVNGAETVNLTNTQANPGPAPTSPTTPTTNPDDPPADVETCAIDGVGWIVCPLVGFLGKVNDGAYAAAEQLLIYSIPDPFSTDAEKNPLYTLWSAMRNVANVLFVVAFFAVIFSQATSMGISAYGIRKMLPRIVIAAILVNLSYYLCVFAIDISNIVGASFDGLLKALPGSAATAKNGLWEEVGSTILAGQATGLAAVGAVVLAYFFAGLFLALAASAILAILITIIILLVRNALITMLIILAPLAFVAYILPNTENLFDKWRKTFISLLVMYPLIALLFAGSKVASDVLLITNQGPASTGGGFVVSTFYQLAALGILTIPLFGVPWIVKFSGGALARITGAMNNRSKGLIDRARNYGEERSKPRRREFVANAANGKYGTNRMRGYERNDDGSLKYDEKGRPIKSAGAGARLKRGRDLMGMGALQSAARSGGDGKWQRENRIREAEKSILDDRIGRLTETANIPQLDDEGNIRRDDQGSIIYAKAPTAAANRMVARAAGVGGEKGQARVRALASEQRRKELGDDIKRAIDDNLNADLYNHDIEVFEKGNREAGPLKMHQRLAAIASGREVEWTDASGKLHSVNGQDMVQRYAAVSRLETTADKKAAAAMYFSAKIADRPRSDFESDDAYQVYIKARQEEKKYTVTDPEIRAEIERAIASSGGLGEAFPEQRKSEAGAYNTVNAMLVSKFSKESTQLAYQFYDKQEAGARASLSAAQASGDQQLVIQAQQQVRSAVSARDNFNKSIVQAIQNPTYSGNFDPGTLAEFERVTRMKVEEIAKSQSPGAGSTSQVTVVTDTSQPSAPTFRPAVDVVNEVTQRVSASGGGLREGVQSLNNQSVTEIWTYTENPNVASQPEAAALRAEALEELKRRGILPS